MKIRYLSLIVLLVMSVFAPMQAQTCGKNWKYWNERICPSRLFPKQ